MSEPETHRKIMRQRAYFRRALKKLRPAHRMLKREHIALVKSSGVLQVQLEDACQECYSLRCELDHWKFEAKRLLSGYEASQKVIERLIGEKALAITASADNVTASERTVAEIWNVLIGKMR